MTKHPIRNLHSNKPMPPRFCDVVFEDGKVFLEVKTDKNKFEKIPWKDVVVQVEAAIDIESTK